MTSVYLHLLSRDLIPLTPPAFLEDVHKQKGGPKGSHDKIWGLTGSRLA